MAALILTSEQMQSVAGLGSPLVVHDPAGNPIGVCSMFNTPQVPGPTGGVAVTTIDDHFTAEEIQQALRNRNSSGVRYSTRQVLDFVHSLEQGQ